MRNRSRISLATITATVLLGLTMAWAAPEKVAITADELSFDGKTNVARAIGNVEITRGNQILRGAEGSYNLSTTEAHLTGGVTMTGEDMALQASEVTAYNNNEIVASGNVFLQKGDRTINGGVVRYNISSEYGTVEGNAVLTSEDMVMQASHIEAWTSEIRAIGTGGVVLQSNRHNLYATGGQIDYRQTPGQNDGVAYLSGGAHAEQNGNVLDGEAFDIRLGDNSIRTKGRSTLVIAPK